MCASPMDERLPPLRLVCSDELGQLKVLQTVDGTQLGTAALTATWGQPDKQQKIDCLQLGSRGGIQDTAGAVLAVARCGGGIELLSPLTGQLLGAIPPATLPPPTAGGKAQPDAGRVRGLHLLWDGDVSSSGLPGVLSITQGGLARVHAPVGGASSEQRGEQQAPAAVAATWEQRRSWAVPPEVCCTAYDAGSGRLAVGCQGTELRLFDVATGELAFAFKGGKPNKVGLVDRPWNTALAFLPPAAQGSGDGGSNSSGGGGTPGSRVLVGTGNHKVRLYDADAGKRPQIDLTWREARVTCMALEPQGQRCWVGNGLGQLEVLDVQAQAFVGAVKGFSGSVRAVAVHPEAAVVASVGLDRYLRLHSTHTRQLLAKVYCKTLPTGLCFCPTDATMLPPEAPKTDTQQGSAEDPDEEEEQQERRGRKRQGEGRRSSSSASAGKQHRKAPRKRRGGDGD